MKRNETRKVTVGNLELGGNNKIYIQSMCTTKTKDIENTVKQILELERVGCEIIRVAVLDMDDAKALGQIKKLIHIPLVADIHFDYKLALEAINQGVDKIRINPGNIKEQDKVSLICKAAKEKNIPIRIGVNSGSLPSDLTPTAENMIIAAKRHIEILEKNDFHDIVLSLKASNVKLMVDAYKLASKEFDYPLHVGVTEAGTNYGGLIKGAIGIGTLLLDGIGNTIRVSLTENPIEEIKAAKQILKSCGLVNNVAELTSCPTCGRIQYDMMEITKEIEDFLLTINKDIHVAIMGCAVNGPGEAREADLGIAGGVNEALLFKKGEIVRKIAEKDIIDELKKEIIAF
jgi:(E)-4-hydroxy-3-methylbut-2-enyl-diphosphate synthase